MAHPEKTIVEVNGVKLEVDMRYARRVEELRVGDRVKILTKDYSSYTVHPGVIIGFEPFAKLPTIIAAYIQNSYDAADVKFIHYNAQSQDVEIVVAGDDDLDFDRGQILQRFDRDIEKKHREIAVIEEKKKYFEQNFKQYWETVALPPVAETEDA